MTYKPPLPDHEPHKVFIHKGVCVDHARNDRAVPYKIYYPVARDLKSLPVILWSHGLGGGRDGAAFLARYIASHGYVMVNLQHQGTDTSLWEGKPGHPWDVIKAAHIPRQDTLDRFHDVPFLLDCLPDIARENPDIGTHMDLGKIGMSGHSFGALTTQVMAGQPFPDKDDKPTSLRETRFKAGILYSFVPMKHLTSEAPEKIYDDMTLPLFFMTGTDDENPISGQGYQYRMPVFDHAGCPEKALLVLKEGDHMVFAGSRGKLESHPKRHLHENIIKTASLAYWEAYLKENKEARQWLTGNGLKNWLGEEGQYEFKRKSSAPDHANNIRPTSPA